MKKDKLNQTCYLLYTEKGNLEISRNERFGNYESALKTVTPNQVLNVGKIFAKKYKNIEICDEHMECIITIGNDGVIDVSTLYNEDLSDIMNKYNICNSTNDDYVDLEKEKWDNYWGDYSQCGVRIDY